MKKEDLAIAFRVVDATPEGRAVFDYLFEFCHVLATSYDPSLPRDAFMFNEGQRSVGNEIASLLTNEPHRFRREVMQRLHEKESETE